jgi:spore photoproduct lyase
MREAALAGYPVGLVVAPIMPCGDWKSGYSELLDGAAEALNGVPEVDLTVELITHRFTAGSKAVLNGWYPGSSLDMDEAGRTKKLTKFGSEKFVYPPELMRIMRMFVAEAIRARLPMADVLYWT